MSFIQQLTDMYKLIHPNGTDNIPTLDFIYQDSFKKYLNELNESQFVNSIFVYGFEVRDEITGSIDSEVTELLNIIQNIYKDKKEVISKDNLLLTKYNIGLINIYLYFCKRTSIENKSIKDINNPELLAYIETTDTSNLFDSNTINDINRSVNSLKEATKLCSETLSISSGIYTYIIMRLFDYIFSVFENYKVDNNGRPPDLDSFYVFTDQLDSNDLWNELAKQMKVKYGYK